MSILAVLAMALAPTAAEEPKFAAKFEKRELPAVAEPIRKLLDPEALVVTRNSSEPVMVIWFRTEIPAKATAEQVKNGLTYREIPEGELVGVIQFPEPFTDFRRQEIPKGTYTLRFAVQPDIGDHTGTSPHPEFCLICPAAKDKSAAAIDKKSLIELSSEVNDGKHPAVLLLFPNTAKDAGPKVVPKGDGVVIVTLRRTLATEDAKTTLGFGITVAGLWKQ